MSVAAILAAALVAFTSNPEGATVEIDGVARGNTPLKRFDLAPNAVHHVRFSLDGYESQDEFVTPGAEGSTTKHAELKPVKGLLLVTSVPSGAQILRNGETLGVTPRLLVSLDANKPHTLVLKKEGYLDYKFEVRFEGRSPYVCDIPLTVDSGILQVKSEPEGAKISINGMYKGETPKIVEGVPKGRVTIAVSKEGWRTESKEVVVRAGDGQECFFNLKPVPGVLRLVAKQEDARFYVNGEPLGKGPVEMKNLDEGEYTIRVECDGFSGEERKTFVSRGKTQAEEFDLVSIVGGLEIRTIPSGATVLIDDRICGKTTGPADPNAKSNVLTLPEVKCGQHTLVIRREGYAQFVKHIEVRRGEMLPVNARLRRAFTPNIRLTTKTGVVEGVLLRQGNGFYTVETSPGVERMVGTENVLFVETIEADAKEK